MVCKRCSAECTCKKVKRKSKPRVGRFARSKPQVIPPMPQQIIYQYLPAVKEKEEIKYIPSVRADYLPEGVPRPTQAPATERAMMGTEDRPRVRETGIQAMATTRETEIQAMAPMQEQAIQTDGNVIREEDLRERQNVAFTEGLTQGYEEGHEAGYGMGYESAMATPLPGAGGKLYTPSSLALEAEKGRKVMTRTGENKPRQHAGIEGVLQRITAQREAMGRGVDIAGGETPAERYRKAQLVAPPAIGGGAVGGGGGAVPREETVVIRRKKPKSALQLLGAGGAGGEQAEGEKEE